LARDLSHEYELRTKARSACRKSKENLQKQREDFSAYLHDWKVPLSVIESSVWLCQRYNKEGQAIKRENHLKRIETALNELKIDFQNWQVWNNPKSLEENRCINIREFMEERLEMLSSSLKKGQKISYWHQGVEYMYTDPYAIRHIVDNLISNAIKYSPQNSKIKIKIWADQKQVRFEIIDQGIGIPKEDIPHLLEPRYRAGNSNGIAGNGLGLSNVNKLIKRLDGLIEIQSTLNQGSTFIITIQNKT
jgi:signal transduction histidine kinase